MDFVRKSAGLALVLAALAAPPAEAGFKGVLNTPAMPTQLAAQRHLNAVVAAGSRLIAAGQRGHIVYSDDHGASWKQATVPVSSDLTAVFFSSDRSGWAVGHDGVVLHSDDAGQNWRLQLDGNRAASLIRDYYGRKAQAGDAHAAALLPDFDKDFSTGADKPFLDVWFANDQEGYVVGAFNLIFRTGDGGKTWEPWLDRLNNPKRLHLYSIRGQGGRVYLAGEQGLVAWLDAGAQRFETIRSPYAGSFFGVLPIDGGAVVFGMRGNAFRIDANGASWQKLETGVVGGLTGAASLGDGRLALVSTVGDVLVGNASTGGFEKFKATRGMLFAGVAFVQATNSLASVGSAGAVIVPLAQNQ
jgi:photosystem II stability/assembly factor-like uncharacterized protein